MPRIVIDSTEWKRIRLSSSSTLYNIHIARTGVKDPIRRGPTNLWSCEEEGRENHLYAIIKTTAADRPGADCEILKNMYLFCSCSKENNANFNTIIIYNIIHIYVCVCICIIYIFIYIVYLHTNIFIIL